MSRNVGFCFMRRLVSLPPCPHNAFAVVCYYSDSKSKAESVVEKSVEQLRALDQKTLYETKIHTHRFISQVNNVTSKVASVPTQIRNPDIPVPYTLGHLRTLAEKDIPTLADRTIAAATKVKEHLNDLQWQPYVDKKSDETLIAEFEKQIQGLSREEKESLLKEWKYEEEARIGRAERDSKRLVDYVDNELRNKPRLAAERDESLLKGSKDVARPEMGRAKPSSEQIQSPTKQTGAGGLTELQKQLEQKMKG